MELNPSTKRPREDIEERPSRPRRLKAPVLQKSHSLHDLVPLIAASSSMPSVVLWNEALFMMSFHSHLCTDEVIGWMGGTISENLIEIKGAFPVNAIAHENGRINVEMDAENALIVRTEIENQGMKIIGWYHSHPTFDVVPSVLDIANQMSYQDISDEYFLGGIISPYYSVNRLEGLFTIFHVKKNAEEFKRNGYHPAYSIKFNLKIAEISDETVNKGIDLVKKYKDHEKSVKTGKKWKKGMTVLQKINKAIECIGLNPSQILQINSSFT